MTRYVLRLVLVFALATLCSSAAFSVYAKDGPKQKAHGAFKQVGEYAGNPTGGFNHFRLEAPDNGYVDYYMTAGPWAGSWAHQEVMQLSFGTYNGSLTELAGSAVACYLVEVVEGEEFTDLSYPGMDPNVTPEYQNISGFYRVGAAGDGGPNWKNDWVAVSSPPIPPDGLPVLCTAFGLCGTDPEVPDGLEQAIMMFYGYVSGFGIDFMGHSWIGPGNITIKLRDEQ